MESKKNVLYRIWYWLQILKNSQFPCYRILLFCQQKPQNESLLAQTCVQRQCCCHPDIFHGVKHFSFMSVFAFILLLRGVA